MGRIPFYERQQLPSARVGTPGVDNSGDNIVHMAGNLGQLTEQYVEAENAKIEVADNIEAEKYRVEFENNYYKTLEETKQQNIDDPYKVSDTSYDLGTTLMGTMSSGISNPRVKAKFLDKAHREVVSGQDKVRNWASQQTTTNAFVNLNSAMEGLATQGGIVKSPQEIGALIESAQKLAINSAPVVGVDKANNVFEVTRKAIVQNFAYSNIDKSPETVKTYIDSGMFDGSLNEHEQLTLKNSADSMIKKRQKQMHDASSGYRLDSVYNLHNKESKGTLTVKEIDTEIGKFKKMGATESDLKSLYNIKKSLLGESGGKSPTGKTGYQVKADTLSDITEEYLDLFSSKGNKKKVYGDVTLSDLQTFQNKVVAAASSKKLDKQTANSMIKNIAEGRHTLMNTKKNVVTNEGIMGFGKKTESIPLGVYNESIPLGVYNEGMSSINNWADKNIKDPKVRNQFKHDAVTEYVGMYDDVKGRKGFTVSKYTNQVIGHYAPKYGKTVQVKKVK